MLDEEAYQRRARRRGWWIRVARETRSMNQAGVAAALGLSRNSASSVGLWERGVAEPSLRQLAQLAILFEAPLSLFTDPPRTDEERFLEQAGGERQEPVKRRDEAVG